MNIAVTGATGFLGKYLIDYFVICSYNVFVIARPQEEAHELFHSNVNIIESDFTLESLVEVLNDVEVVVHLAAQTMQRDSDPLKVSQFYHVNVQITENVLLAAQQNGIKQLVHISSNSVYSGANKLPFTEKQNPIPSNVYGVSKLYSEKIGEFVAHKTGMNVASLRLARLFGYGERETVVFSKYMKLASEGKDIEIWGDGKTAIDFLYVHDAVKAIELTVKNNIQSGVYNVGSNKAYSIKEIAQTIKKVYYNRINIIFDKSKKEVNYYIKMDSSKFRKEVSWQPEWNLENAIRDMIKYYNK